MALYETAADVARETAMAARIETAFNVTLRKMPGPYPIDWYAERNGRVVAWVELKTSTAPSTEYGTALISLRKLEALLGHSARNVPGVFVVGFPDGVWFVDARQIDPRAAVVLSRHVHRKPEDTEPVVKVPIADMRPIGGR